MWKNLYYGLRRILRRARRRALRLCRRQLRRFFRKLGRILTSGRCRRIAGFCLGQFSDGVDSLADKLKSTPGELHYNVKDQFPKFIKQSIEWVPLPYWWTFEFAIVLGFVNALYRRMS